MKQDYIAVPVSLIENMCKALSEYELTDKDWKDCFGKIHDACVDIDAFCRDKLHVEALEQQPCEDEYIKVPKKALKYRTAGTVAYNAEWLKNHFDIERAVICGEQEPCNDCISRQAAIDAIWDGVNMDIYTREVKECLEQLPSVTPAEKVGHWIEERTYMECPNCHDIWHYEENQTERFKYCPTCGAKMEVKE